jgi:hypothetical protein
MDDVKTPKDKCVHSVHRPSRLKPGEANDCCSVCCPIIVPEDAKYVVVKNAETGRWENVRS